MPPQVHEPPRPEQRPVLKSDPGYQAALAQLVEDARALLAADQPTPKPAAGYDDQSLVSALALAVQMADQGYGRKTQRVPPDQLAARELARQRMIDLILAAREAGEIPVYQLKNKVYLDEVLVDPIYIDSNHIHRHEEIEWRGVPNEAMTPVNAIAERIYAEYRQMVGSVQSVAPDDRLSVTAGGLVVKHGAQRRSPEAPPTGDGEAYQGLGVKSRQRPEGVATEARPHVLGTVAALPRNVGVPQRGGQRS